jgi:hypothetical protein
MRILNIRRSSVALFLVIEKRNINQVWSGRNTLTRTNRTMIEKELKKFLLNLAVAVKGARISEEW